MAPPSSRRRRPESAIITANLQQAVWTDAEGRNWTVWIPEGLPKAEWSSGIPIGPPSLAELGLPLSMEVALHNELNARAIFTFKDAKHRGGEVIAAWQTVLRVDAHRVIDVFALAERE